MKNASSAAPQIPLVSEDAGIELRTVTITALAVRGPNHSARSHPLSARSHPHSATDLIHTRLQISSAKLTSAYFASAEGQQYVTGTKFLNHNVPTHRVPNHKIPNNKVPNHKQSS